MAIIEDQARTREGLRALIGSSDGFECIGAWGSMEAALAADWNVPPNVVLVAITCWVWWPRSDREWNKFGLVMAYLVVFYLVMKFVFRFR